MSAAPAAGWYPDPSNPSQQRWWDGSTWGDQTAPGARSPQAGLQYGSDVSGGGGLTPGSAAAAARTGSTDPRYQHDRFVIRQWRRPMVNKYEVHVAEGAGDKPAEGEVVAFVQQKRLTMKQKIQFYTNKDKSVELLNLEAQKKMDWGGRHTLTDVTTGEKVGELNKKLGMSAFVSSTWHVLDAAGNEIAYVTEKSMAFALLRRYGPDGLSIFPYDFVITAAPGAQSYGVSPGTILGHHKRRWGIREIYDLDLSADASKMFDRRLAVGMAIGLDALEHR